MRTLDRHFGAVAEPDQLSVLLRKMEELTLLELQDWLTLMSFAKLEAAG